MDLNLGQMIRQKRQAAGLTLEDVAEQVGVTVGALSHIESGRRLPSAANAMLIARTLDIPAEEMLDALDREHSLKRESVARQSLQSSSEDPRVLRYREERAYRAVDAYERRPIEDLFASRAPAPVPVPEAHRASGQLPNRNQRHTDSVDARNSARWSADTSERIEALDRLADSASEAIRTLRGMLDDDDALVAREARRLLRELDVRIPEE